MLTGFTVLSLHFLSTATGPDIKPGDPIPAEAKPEPLDLKLPLRDAKRCVSVRLCLQKAYVSVHV